MTTASTKSAPRSPPSDRLPAGALGAGAAPPTPPATRHWSVVTSSWPPPPPHRGGRAPGTRIGTGAAPEPPKTPLGLLGLVVVAGGSRTARYWAVYPGDTRVRAACAIAVKFLARKQSSHELILAAKASNGGGHSSCSTDTTPGRGSGWPRLRGSGGVPVRARGHSVGALRGRQSPELIRLCAQSLRANLLCRSRHF